MSEHDAEKRARISCPDAMDNAGRESKRTRRTDGSSGLDDATQPDEHEDVERETVSAASADAASTSAGSGSGAGVGAGEGASAVSSAAIVTAGASTDAGAGALAFIAAETTAAASYSAAADVRVSVGAGTGAGAGAGEGAGAGAGASAAASSAPREQDPVAAAQEYSRLARELGLRRHVCHICETEFHNGTALNSHLAAASGAAHAEHRARMAANSSVSKSASIEHRAAMESRGAERKTGVGARVVFKATGDVIDVIGRLDAPDNAWQLTGGRICKFKTEGQRWRWECDAE